MSELHKQNAYFIVPLTNIGIKSVIPKSPDSFPTAIPSTLFDDIATTSNVVTMPLSTVKITIIIILTEVNVTIEKKSLQNNTSNYLFFSHLINILLSIILHANSSFLQFRSIFITKMDASFAFY